MSLTPQQLRYDYPEFASTSDYPNSQIVYWINIAYLMLNAPRWGKLLDVGAALFVAHNITLEAKDQATAKNGGTPGQSSGLVSSKSVDKVSVSYDTGSAIEPNAGHWNLTTYGTRFVRMSRMFGAGPVQIGAGAVPPLSGQAWAGPNIY